MMNRQGWIKIHRQILNNPIVTKDSDHFAIWMYLLLEAQHKPYDKVFNGKRITLQPGQLITGRKVIANHLNVSESKVFRVLKFLKSEQQIEQQTSSKSSMITVLNWDTYQVGEQHIEQQVNNNRTTSEQQVNTLQEGKNDNNEIKEIISLLNISTGKSYKPGTGKTRSLINARFSDGFTMDDFKSVISAKCAEWKGDEKMDKFLRPETLFGTKFEGYLNEGPSIGNDLPEEVKSAERALQRSIDQCRAPHLVEMRKQSLKEVKEKHGIK